MIRNTYNLKWLTDRFDSGETLKYIFFWGHASKNAHDVGKFIFSQWFHAPFTVDGIQYKTTEHWMMAHKAMLFGDKATFDKIVAASKPAEAKDLGRKVFGFDEIKWDQKKFEIVRTGNIHKFHQHKELKNFLLATNDRVIVEASPTDTIWGIGLSEDSKMVDNHIVGEGRIYWVSRLWKRVSFCFNMGILNTQAAA